LTGELKFSEERGYLYLQDFVDKDSCRLMTESLMNAVKDGGGVNDPQCPHSPAFYEGFEVAQMELLPELEKITGKKLLKTYNYCRLYQPGEILEKHTDRESCEYSITLNIGFSGATWPFFIETSSGEIVKMEMNVGDAILYKGIERPHWREKYSQGDWQAQIFFHYVDAEGAYKNHSIFEKIMKEKNVFIQQT
jgi:hypothetical protein